MSTCPQCGHEIRVKALFCPNCGHKLPQESPPKTDVSPDEAAPIQEQRGCRQSLIVLGIALLVVLAIIGVGAAAVYYGLADRAKVEQQVAQEHYEKGLQHLSQGELELAIAEFELVLQLNPKHSEAQAKLAEARQQLAAQPTATPMLQQETKAALFEELVQAHRQQDWEGVMRAADRLLEMDPEYRRSEVNAMLFDAFSQRGQQLVQEDREKEAVRLFDRALGLQPDNAQVAHAKNLATLYMEGMSYWGADWAKAIEKFKELYRLAPDYKDVRQRLYEALLSYGDLLARDELWCEAAEQYTEALGVKAETATVTKRQEAAERCDATPQATPGAQATASMPPGPTAPPGTYAGILVEQTGIEHRKMFIRGKVLNKEGRGVPGVRVKIQAWDWSAIAVTDGNGQYAFDGLANPVTYTLSLLDLPSIPFEVAGVWGKISWVDFREAP